MDPSETKRLQNALHKIIEKVARQMMADAEDELVAARAAWEQTRSYGSEEILPQRERQTEQARVAYKNRLVAVMEGIEDYMQNAELKVELELPLAERSDLATLTRISSELNCQYEETIYEGEWQITMSGTLEKVGELIYLWRHDYETVVGLFDKVLSAYPSLVDEFGG